jgi:hypothetical protein
VVSVGLSLRDTDVEDRPEMDELVVCVSVWNA